MSGHATTRHDTTRTGGGLLRKGRRDKAYAIRDLVGRPGDLLAVDEDVVAARCRGRDVESLLEGVDQNARVSVVMCAHDTHQKRLSGPSSWKEEKLCGRTTHLTLSNAPTLERKVKLVLPRSCVVSAASQHDGLTKKEAGEGVEDTVPGTRRRRPSSGARARRSRAPSRTGDTP